ncbi:hypothetical protein ACUODF_21490, partial [Escherichia coli]
MKKVLLQNHPGSEKYSFNGWEIFNSNFERMIKENKAMLLCKWGFYLTCVVAVMFVFAAITSNGLNERGLITAGCSFLYLLNISQPLKEYFSLPGWFCNKTFFIT